MGKKRNVIRIAMWSGPRNISTALMRAWGNRPDAVVCDEPLYAFYLQQTQLPHPGRDEVIDCHETNWRKVVDHLLGELPGQASVFYQKQMAHHMLPEIELDWLAHLQNCFLIRKPSEMLTSLMEFIPAPTLEDTGLPQQWRIFEHVMRQSGQRPLVLDSRDILERPRAMLQQLCENVGVDFLESMLSWPTGPRKSDGVWARHWYKKVEQTTGFGGYRPKHDVVPDNLENVLMASNEIYQRLYEHRLG